MVKKETYDYETIYRLYPERVLSHPARPAHDADTDRNAHRTDYPFGFAISTEVRNVETAVLMPSSDAEVQRIVERLDASEYFHVKYIVHSSDEIDRLFKRNRIELAVVFPSDLNRLRMDAEDIQLIADATDPNLAVTRSTYANGILHTALNAIKRTGTKQMLPPASSYRASCSIIHK